MIADSELVKSTADSIVLHGTTEDKVQRSRLFDPLLFFILLGVVIALQFASGAYRSEFSGYPDEPAHYVTSLMLRDYLVHFHLQSPLLFAEDYYRHYPKVAFGHWPPLFYILQSIWMMLFSASRASIRLEMAVTTALLGYSVYLEARRWFGWKTGFLAGLLTVALPLVQNYSDQEMAEGLLTLVCFWSVIYFARYVSSERMSDALLFGVFFSLAVLTKGSGWLLALVPPIVLVLTKRVRLMLKFSFWAPVALVSVICIPWQLMTMQLADRGWDGGAKPSLAYTAKALLEFLELFPGILGPVFIAFLLAGIGALVLLPFWRGRVSAAGAGQFALLVSVWVFHSLVPAGVEDRKLVIAVPAMILLLLAGARYLADLLPRTSFLYGRRYALAAAVCAVSFLLTSFSIPKVPRYGFIDAARFLTSRSDFKNTTILVSSESIGEGLLISEVAMREPQPTDVILRGTKALAAVAWNGVDYHSTYSSPQQITGFLQGHDVHLVVMDTYPPQNHFAHNALLRRAINGDSRFRLLANFSSDKTGPAGEVQIYRFNY